ncbi:MAG: glycine--tRNA ligase, partial [Clostridia bacterium]|nr:glycine--tRNA ligase [Clostridia bacterium]
PFKAAVLPLSKKLSEKALEIYDELSKHFMVDYDEAGSIGKRYRREDEVGTPFCITYDFESEQDGCVTVRDRDTMEQVRIPITELVSYIEEKIKF